MTGQIIVLLIILIIGGSVLIIWQKVKSISKEVFGVDDIVEGLKMQQAELATTPKSVSGMTKIYLPQIQLDFPQFNYEQFKHKVENMLTASIISLNNGDFSNLTEVSEEWKHKLSNIVTDCKNSATTIFYGQLEIHRTEICNYKKSEGTCIITLQSAIQYIHYEEKDGKVTKGSKEFLEQTKYNIDILYIQDIEKMKYRGNTIGLVCPNCGAPITNLGQKFCEYCGSGIVDIQERSWILNSFNEV